MRASVVIRSKDEAPRLRLTLASLSRQTELAEVVVVNDGSTDQTSAVIDEAASMMSIVAHHNEKPVGRSQASNLGAARASGDIVIFLDGDTLAAPDLVARHLAIHQVGTNQIARGETFHLRGTRLFSDPETGTAMPGEEKRVFAMPEKERESLLLTRLDIINDFDGIDARAQAGIYPGVGPRRLYEMEMDALRSYPDCPVLWAAASGSNQSVTRDAFLDAGGFAADISINEHRELALRMVRAGACMTPVDGARTYHMTHRKGWRNPLTDRDWEARFYSRYSVPEVALLSVLWAGISDPGAFPEAARMRTLPELAKAARRFDGIVGVEAVQQAYFASFGALAEVDAA